MYIYLRKLKKVKDPNRKRSKKAKVAEKATVVDTYEEIPETYADQDQIIDYLGTEELATLSEVDLQEEIQVLDEHPSTTAASSILVPATSPVAKPCESAVLKSPTGGGDLIYLQKLKKVKKPKASKLKVYPGNQRSVKEFFAKKERD